MALPGHWFAIFQKNIRYSYFLNFKYFFTNLLKIGQNMRCWKDQKIPFLQIFRLWRASLRLNLRPPVIVTPRRFDLADSWSNSMRSTLFLWLFINCPFSFNWPVSCDSFSSLEIALVLQPNGIWSCVTHDYIPHSHMIMMCEGYRIVTESVSIFYWNSAD